MKILIFTEGTIIMHKNAFNHTRKEIVQQVEESKLQCLVKPIPIDAEHQGIKPNKE